MKSSRSTYRHPLVVLGDSLSQGFQNNSIYRSDLGFAGFLARALDIDDSFRQPAFEYFGGLPLNMEMVIRELSSQYDHRTALRWYRYPEVVFKVLNSARKVRNHWMRHETPLKTAGSTPYHNQSVWGYAINDAWQLTERLCSEYIRNNPARQSMFSLFPGHAMYTTARHVLNPKFKREFADHTLVDNVNWFSGNGGIENLIVYLGNNHVTGSVTDLQVTYSEPDELLRYPHDRNYTVMRPEHFEQLYRKLAERVARLKVRRVFAGTIPYVTIPPITHGINDSGRVDSEYFDYYTKFWIWDEQFDPGKHRYLTREQAIDLDNTVDAYNKIIRDVAREYGWHVIPINRYVYAMATRRHRGRTHLSFPDGLVEALQRNPDTGYLVQEGRARLDTRYLGFDRDTGGLQQGGVFSLDGLHPTTIGYGLLAQLFYNHMQRNGVAFPRPIDWDHIVASDTLITRPPHLLAEMKTLLNLMTFAFRRSGG